VSATEGPDSPLQVNRTKAGRWYDKPWIRVLALTVGGAVAPQLCALAPGPAGVLCNTVVRAVVMGLNGVVIQQEQARTAGFVDPCTQEFCSQFSGPGHGLQTDAGFCLCPFR